MYPQQTELKSEKIHYNAAERPSSPLTVNVSQIRKRQNNSKCEMNKNSNEKGPKAISERNRSPPHFKDDSNARKPPPAWRKVLYDRDPSVPDNYAPKEFFLAAIERNKNLHKYSFGACVKGSCQVALQVFAVLLLALCYIALADNNCFVFGKSCRYILLMSIIFSCFLGYGFTYLTRNGYLWISRIPNSKPKSRNNPKKLNWCGSVQQGDVHPSQSLKLSIKQATIFITFGLALSPVLYKLTDTISTDTIYTMTFLVLLIHLLFHDYGLRSSFVSHPLSLNAGLFAAVCLASRLPTSFDAFVLLSASVQTFVLYPIFRRNQIVELESNVAVAVGLCVFTIMASHLLSSCAIAIYAAVTFIVIVLLCPSLFIHWQNYKDTIHGPWDEAVPKFG